MDGDLNLGCGRSITEYDISRWWTLLHRMSLEYESDQLK